ncbi:unnamed protein product [Dovyalis caffra]|uniref:Uncharacterized protein n=1 Tax=Dovyalis caffra TaxID=77055 RepID=A0AAV1SMS9_9ROSI|nr:unnamed protein product [Dovyalis caffra]
MASGLKKTVELVSLGDEGEIKMETGIWDLGDLTRNISTTDADGDVDDEVPVEDVLSGLEDRSDCHQLREAFKIFYGNGNGYIELKTVLQCLGLDKRWDMDQLQKMLKAADLNFNGKIDLGMSIQFLFGK